MHVTKVHFFCVLFYVIFINITGRTKNNFSRGEMTNLPLKAVIKAPLFSDQNSGTGFNLQSGTAPSGRKQHFCKIPQGWAPEVLIFTRRFYVYSG